MKYRLFDFQQDAVSQLLKKMDSMQNSYQNDGSLSAVSLTAPTGAGKTVISAAVARAYFMEMTHIRETQMLPSFGFQTVLH